MDSRREEHRVPLPEPSRPRVVRNPLGRIGRGEASCTCCETYAAYLEQNGFQVKLIPTNDLEQISTKMGVPENLQGCHTITVDSYLVVGFVPVDQVKKMLKEVNLFDLFEDENKLGAGKKSYAVSFSFEDLEKTLQDKEIDAAMQQLQQAFETKLNATIRT